MSRIAIPALGPTPESPSSTGLPHAPFIVLHDPDAGTFEALPNPAAQAQAHRGMVVAAFLLKRGVTAVVGHRMGPHPVQALRRAAVPIHEGREGLPVRDVAALWARGELPALPDDAPLADHAHHRGSCGCGHEH